MIERMMKILSSTDNQPNNFEKENSTVNVKQEINVSNLIERGQQLLKDRSVLFRTPKNITKIYLKPVTPKNVIAPTPRTAKFSES